MYSIVVVCICGQIILLSLFVMFSDEFLRKNHTSALTSSSSSIVFAGATCGRPVQARCIPRTLLAVNIAYSLFLPLTCFKLDDLLHCGSATAFKIARSTAGQAISSHYEPAMQRPSQAAGLHRDCIICLCVTMVGLMSYFVCLMDVGVVFFHQGICHRRLVQRY